jgi:hypothetical protein
MRYFHPMVWYLQHMVNDDVYYNTVNFDCLWQAVFIGSRNHMHLEIEYNKHTDLTHTYT